MINSTNQVLIVLLAAVCLFTLWARVDYSRPNYEVLPDMKYTPAAMAYATNSVFPNGRTLQAPVPGTIARGERPIHFQATKEDAERAGRELVNPFPLIPDEATEQEIQSPPVDSTSVSDPAAPDEPDPETEEVANAEMVTEADLGRQRYQASVQRGAETYRVFCMTCHGAAGLGDGPVPQRGFPPPPSLQTGKSVQMQDGQLFHILTYGQGGMAPFSGQLAPEQRWDVINPRTDAASECAG